MTRSLVALAITLSLAAAGGAVARDGGISKVNGSIDVASGEQAGNVETVNGSVRLADGAAARKATTVNGSIKVGANANAEALETVNGDIELHEGARVAGDVETVNGDLRLHKGAEVGGRASNVSGRLTIEAAHVGAGLQTVNGDIDVGADSRIEGGILVEKPHGWSWGKQRNPRIVIGPRAVVQGTLDLRRDVELFVSDSANVGEIKGATATKFAGDRP